MGRGLVEELLNEAVEGRRGMRAAVNREGWENLLASRVAGNEAALKQALAAAAGDDPALANRLRFCQEVLDAPLVVELGCVYHRLNRREERAAFVIGEQSNWLLANAAWSRANTWIWAVCLPRTALQQAVTAIFTPLEAAERRARSA